MTVIWKLSYDRSLESKQSTVNWKIIWIFIVKMISDKEHEVYSIIYDFNMKNMIV